MRILTSIQESRLAKRFSSFLADKNIVNLCEYDNDKKQYNIWVHDDNQIADAENYYDQYKLNPNSPEFDVQPTKPIKENKINIKPAKKQHQIFNIAPLTMLLLSLCIILFIASTISNNSRNNHNNSTIFSPVKKYLLFDFPQQYEVIEKINAIRIANKADSNNNEKQLKAVLNKNRSWTGLVNLLLEKRLTLHNIKNSMHFEKIKQGQVWRLFTPCLLHADIIHLLFNMMWLVVLSNQIEKKIGLLRLAIITLSIGIVSNTAQYIISGPVFLGYSGIICGMITFIWQRQKKHPWELYDLQPSTMKFITIFVFGMLTIQLISIATVYLGHKPLISLNIANTAHLAGGVAGYILSKLKLFSVR